MNVVIPRPGPDGDLLPGVGKVTLHTLAVFAIVPFLLYLRFMRNSQIMYLIILETQVFLEYTDVEGAAKARNGLNGRRFGGNVVTAVFYPQNKLAQGDYEG